MDDELDRVKQDKWFYEFLLPDGTRTESSEEPHMRAIHVTRENVLRSYLARTTEPRGLALDVACHEGYFSHVLAEHFANVVGIDKNEDSLARARRMAAVLERTNLKFERTSVEDLNPAQMFDFVLCYGLLYHTENPVGILRKIASLARKSICVETQVLPFETSGSIEDGSYLAQRPLMGSFGLCGDYPHSTQGGTTDVALVPSRAALLFLLRQFGFRTVEVYQPSPDDYEQFVRGSRIIVYAAK
jgi:SAM-dependent methyltransferase